MASQEGDRSASSSNCLGRIECSCPEHIEAMIREHAPHLTPNVKDAKMRAMGLSDSTAKQAGHTGNIGRR